MNIFERMMIYLLSYSCWLSWQVSKINIKKYFFDMFSTGSKVYNAWTNLFKFIIGILFFLVLWAIIFHLIK